MDGTEVPISKQPFGFDGGIVWRDQGRWVFFTEVADRRYYLFEDDFLQLELSTDIRRPV